jgi:hypothetical protein
MAEDLILTGKPLHRSLHHAIQLPQRQPRVEDVAALIMRLQGDTPVDADSVFRLCQPDGFAADLPFLPLLGNLAQEV